MRNLSLGVLLFLALPVAAAESPPVPEEAVLADLPFLDCDSSHIWVDLSPDPEAPLEVMLDTGAPFSPMGAARVRGLGRRPHREVRFETSTGKRVTFNTEISEERETGIVGHDFLRRFVVEFDYPRRFLDRARYETPETVEDPAESILPLTIRQGKPEVELEVNGHPIRAVFDTGGLMGLSLQPSAAREIGLEPDTWPVVGLVRLATGNTAIRLAELETIRLDRFRFDGFPVTATVKDIPWVKQDAIVGPDLLRHFVVRYDVANRRVWLRLENNGVATYGGLPYAPGRDAGALLYEPNPGRFLVLSLVPGSRAHLRGVHTRDWFVSSREDRTEAFEDIHARLASDEPIEAHRLGENGDWQVVVLGPALGADSSAAD